MLHTTTRAKKNLVNSNELDCCARGRINFLQNNHDHSGSFLVCFLSFPVTPLSFTFLSWSRYPATSISIHTLLYFGSQKTRLLSLASDLTTSKRIIGTPELVRWEGIIEFDIVLEGGNLSRLVTSRPRG